MQSPPKNVALSTFRIERVNCFTATAHDNGHKKETLQLSRGVVDVYPLQRVKQGVRC